MLALRMIQSAWFDHLEESFCCKEVQVKTVCRPVKTSCPPAQNINETPVIMEHHQGSYRSWKTWKVMESCNFIFQAWKVMEFRFGSWKVLENQYAFLE